VNIVLIGYRGSGKTTVGQLLSARFGWAFVDTDRRIEQRAGKTIKDIFAQHGEAHFRDLERQVVAELCREDQTVISLGGGAVLDPRNQDELSRDSLVVYLEAPAEVLWDRIQQDEATTVNRPNLTTGGLEEVVQLLEARQFAYRDNADAVVDAQPSPVEVTEEIENLWQRHAKR